VSDHINTYIYRYMYISPMALFSKDDFIYVLKFQMKQLADIKLFVKESFTYLFKMRKSLPHFFLQ